MDRTVNVALVRGDRRRDAVAAAFALIRDDLRAIVAPTALMLPGLSGREVTHVDSLSVTFDFLVAAGVEDLVVACASREGLALFERLGYRREAIGRPVRFVDLGTEDTDWQPLESQGQALRMRLSGAILRSPCLVLLGVASKAAAARASFSCENLFPSLHFDDTRGSTTAGAFESVRASLARAVKPRLSIVDAFDRQRTIIVGTDPLAVDAVAAAVMGFDPARIEFLRKAYEDGLGVCDLGRIRILGDPLVQRRRFGFVRKNTFPSTPHVTRSGKRDRVA